MSLDRKRTNPDMLFMDRETIALLGGCTQMSKLLGLGARGPSRVNNWRNRGIPAHVKLARPDLFMLVLPEVTEKLIERKKQTYSSDEQRQQRPNRPGNTAEAA